MKELMRGVAVASDIMYSTGQIAIGAAMSQESHRCMLSSAKEDIL
jgi:hypothetical protein